jgi:predicted permease
MTALLTGIVPVFAMIALGWGLKWRTFLNDDGWRAVERLTYFVFYPTFLIPAVWRADFAGGAAGPVAAATVAVALTMALLTVLAKPMLRISDPAFTSVFQGVIRWNGFVFLPVAGAVFGEQGLGIAAVAGLSFRYAASRPLLMLTVTVIKLIILPVGMYWLTGVLGGDRMAQGLALLAGASPGAAASYVMARQMGGDAPLMAGVVALTTVVSALTIPILLAVFNYI